MLSAARPRTTKSATKTSVTSVDTPEHLRGNINREQADDALLWWGQLTGKESMDWTEPQAPISVSDMSFADLRNSAIGLSTVTRLIRMGADSTVSNLSGPILSGLAAAAVALAEKIDVELDQLSLDGMRKARATVSAPPVNKAVSAEAVMCKQPEPSPDHATP